MPISANHPKAASPSLCDKANAFEALAAAVVDLAVRERAAYRAWRLADPYSRITFRRAHETVAADLNTSLIALIEFREELIRSDLAHFARNVFGSTIARCDVVQALAVDELLAGFRVDPDHRDLN